MLNPKEAVERAEEHLRLFFPPDETKHFRVEAVELPESGSEWRITFGWEESGYRTVGGSALAMGRATIERIPRVYKKVRIAADSGEFKGMDPLDLD
jgi:hypothetical protein